MHILVRSLTVLLLVFGLAACDLPPTAQHVTVTTASVAARRRSDWSHPQRTSPTPLGRPATDRWLRFAMSSRTAARERR